VIISIVVESPHNWITELLIEVEIVSFYPMQSLKFRVIISPD